MKLILIFANEMRASRSSLSLVALALMAGPLVAEAQRGTVAAVYGRAPETASRLLRVASPGDSATRRRFDVPSQTLADALAEFSRQAGIRVELDAGARQQAELRSAAVAGTYTAAEALRLLVAGSGYAVRFAEADVAVVRRAQADTAAQRLRGVVVTGTATRRPGYGLRTTASATRTETPLRDVPQSVSVVTRELIADQAMQGMADVVRYVPGITMGQGEGHRDAPTIRGNSSTADFFVDGVRDDAQYLRDVYNLDRVEALKGANAMTFGRGGGGGVLNRVTKEAGWTPVSSLSMQGGSFEQTRSTLDLGRGFGRRVAARVNGLYENSGGFRDAADVKRVGVNPTVTIAAGARTTARLGYELFRDDRRTDRGLPSHLGRPYAADIATFFGNPTLSVSDLEAHLAGVVLEHVTTGGATIRNRTRTGSYDKFYSNVFPGAAVNAAGTQVNLAAYSNAMQRDNLFNQTEVTTGLVTGAVSHVLLAGAEVGRQRTHNFRRTGYFNDAGTSFAVPTSAPTVEVPVTFRQSASDADNGTEADVLGAYVQDQVTLSSKVQALAGVRVERFAVRFHDSRTGQRLDRTDGMVSPRLGLVVKPLEPLSLYASYSLSFLPSSGEQFSALTATTSTLAPERFTNYEAGAKWDVLPELSLTAAVYRLDRTNTTAPNPTTPGQVVLTGEQRSTGVELGVTGRFLPRWEIAGGLASQRALIMSRTSAAPAGATVPLVPHTTASLWNKVRVLSPLSLGFGVVHQTKMYAAIDNAVTLPAFTRVDGGAYWTILDGLRAQLNVENLLDARYFPTSHGNNNIMPGAPRTLRLSVVVDR